MELEAAATLLGSWLDIERVSAPERTAEMAQRNSEKDAGVLGPYRGNLERIALHESAHAVVALRSGFPIKRVCVRTDGSGAVEYGPQAPDADIVAMISGVTVDLAGVAVDLLLGADASRQFALAHSFDVLQAGMRIKVCRERMPAWDFPSRMFANMSLGIVASNWRSIERLATALHALRDLNGDEVRALCGGAEG